MSACIRFLMIVIYISDVQGCSETFWDNIVGYERFWKVPQGCEVSPDILRLFCSVLICFKLFWNGPDSSEAFFDILGCLRRSTVLSWILSGSEKLVKILQLFDVLGVFWFFLTCSETFRLDLSKLPKGSEEFSNILLFSEVFWGIQWCYSAFWGILGHYD